MKRHAVFFKQHAREGTVWFEHEADAQQWMASILKFPNTEAQYICAFDPVADVQAFHEKFGINYAGKPRMLDFETLQFRLKFMREELQEYEEHADYALFELKNYAPGDPAIDQANLTHELAQQLDALVDQVYVILGTAHLHGFDFRQAWERVHQANMAKVLVDAPNDPSERMKLKISKPPGWESPKHDDLVEDNIHQA